MGVRPKPTNPPNWTPPVDSRLYHKADEHSKNILDVDYLWKNVWNVVDPVGQRAVDQVENGKRFPLGVDDEVLPHGPLLLFLCFLVELVVADRRDLRPGTDAGDLRAQVVGLVARERRIAGDLREITAHEHHTLLRSISSVNQSIN